MAEQGNLKVTVNVDFKAKVRIKAEEIRVGDQLEGWEIKDMDRGKTRPVTVTRVSRYYGTKDDDTSGEVGTYVQLSESYGGNDHIHLHDGWEVAVYRSFTSFHELSGFVADRVREVIKPLPNGFYVGEKIRNKSGDVGVVTTADRARSHFVDDTDKVWAFWSNLGDDYAYWASPNSVERVS